MMFRRLCFCLLLAPLAAQLVRRERRLGRLRAALREALRAVPAERVLYVEDSLRASYEAFPKDAKGNLPPHQALPSLARAYFAKEHGWLVRGLESPGAPIIAPGESYREAQAGHGAGEIYEAHALQDRVPELVAALKEAAESPAAVGLSLADAAMTTAALEQILLEESSPLLEAAYRLNGVEASREMDHDTQEQVLLSYLLLFRHGLPRDLHDAEKHRLMKERAQRSSDWAELQRFAHGALTSSVEEVVKDLARKYGRWQNSECEEMRSTLVTMSSSPGRVALTDFHGSPKYPHYQFTEKEEYLKQAGILEEEGGEKYVLIANYLLGASNCIASSEYFAVCCINECEELVNHFEASLQAPGAPIEQVSRVASELNASSLEQLPLAAKEGVVAWQSAAFRRWLHAAFPLQCPRPTEAEDAAVEAELAEAKEWLAHDEAERRSWTPLVLRPSECTRTPEWRDDPEHSAEMEV